MLLNAPSVLTAHSSLGDTGVTALVAADPAGMVAAVLRRSARGPAALSGVAGPKPVERE